MDLRTGFANTNIVSGNFKRTASSVPGGLRMAQARDVIAPRFGSETETPASKGKGKKKEEETFLTKLWSMITAPFRWIMSLFGGSGEDDKKANAKGAKGTEKAKGKPSAEAERSYRFTSPEGDEYDFTQVKLEQKLKQFDKDKKLDSATLKKAAAAALELIIHIDEESKKNDNFVLKYPGQEFKKPDLEELIINLAQDGSYDDELGSVFLDLILNHELPHCEKQQGKGKATGTTGPKDDAGNNGNSGVSGASGPAAEQGGNNVVFVGAPSVTGPNGTFHITSQIGGGTASTIQTDAPSLHNDGQSLLAAFAQAPVIQQNGNTIIIESTSATGPTEPVLIGLPTSGDASQVFSINSSDVTLNSAASEAPGPTKSFAQIQLPQDLPATTKRVSLRATPELYGNVAKATDKTGRNDGILQAEELQTYLEEKGQALKGKNATDLQDCVDYAVALRIQQFLKLATQADIDDFEQGKPIDHVLTRKDLPEPGLQPTRLKVATMEAIAKALPAAELNFGTNADDTEISAFKKALEPQPQASA